MARIAYLKNDFICIGGADHNLGPSDFNYYIDNVPASPSISHIETAGSQKCHVIVNGNTCTIRGYAQINSTTEAEDLAATYPNTWEDDIKTGSFSFGIKIYDYDGNYYTCLYAGYYYAAVNPPNISISRINRILALSSNDLYTLLSSSNINRYSPYKPSGTPPYSMADMIRYCHIMPGNAGIVDIDARRTIVQKFPVSDADTDLTKFVLKYYKNGVFQKQNTFSLATTSKYTYDYEMYGQSGATVSYEVELFRTTNAGVEHLVNEKQLSITIDPASFVITNAASTNFTINVINNVVFTINATKTMQYDMYYQIVHRDASDQWAPSIVTPATPAKFGSYSISPGNGQIVEMPLYFQAPAGHKVVQVMGYMLTNEGNKVVYEIFLNL